MKFLLDENVDPSLRKAILQKWPAMTVWMVGEAGAPSLSTLDPDILNWCEQHDFALITNNRKSIPVHLRDHFANGNHIPGIFIINSTMSIGETAEEIGMIWEAGDPTEFRDIIEHLPL